MKRRLHLAPLLPLLFASGLALGARPSVPMALPDPLETPQELSPEQVTRALKSALVGRGWEPVDVQYGVVDATLQVREHRLQLRFTLSGDAIHFQYLDSAVLGYEVEDGVPHIHPSVMKWTQLLANDVRANLLRY